MPNCVITSPVWLANHAASPTVSRRSAVRSSCLFSPGTAANFTCSASPSIQLISLISLIHDIHRSLMLQAYPDVQVVIVMDNASYHRSRASLAVLSLFAARLYVVWLPRYCPFLNAIERFWLHLKSLAAANCLHHDMADLIAAID